MVGLIIVVEDCDDGELDVVVCFDVMFFEGIVYQVFVDEVLYGNLIYVFDNL